MIKKFIVLIISLFLISPIAFADASNIVPGMTILNNNTNNKILYELKGKNISLSNPNNVLKTYYKAQDNVIYELKGKNISLSNPNNVLKTYYMQ